MRKVLHYISGVCPIVGGIESFVLNVASTKDFKVDVLTRFFIADSSTTLRMKECGIEIYSLDVQHLNVKSYLCYKKRLYSFLLSNAKKYDAIHIHSTEDLHIARFARKVGFNSIAVHIHSELGSGGTIKRILKRISLIENCKYADSFFACSRMIANKEYPCWVKKHVVVVNNVIDTDHFIFNRNLRMAVRQKYNLDDLTICHIGRFVPEKNQRFIIDVFSEIIKNRPRAKLILVGDGPDKEIVERKCNEKGIMDSVLFIGAVLDVNPYLQASDVFIFPSLHEGFGMVAIESQATGLKVVAARCNVPFDIKVTDLVCFVPLDNNPDEWAQTILNDSKTNVDRVKYYQLVKQAGFDRTNTIKQLQKTYYNCLGEKV